MIKTAIHDCESLIKKTSESFGFITGLLKKPVRIPIRVSYLILKKLDVIEDNKIPFDKKELYNTIINYLEESVHIKNSDPDMKKTNEALIEVSKHIPKENTQDYLNITNNKNVFLTYNQLDLKDKKEIFNSARTMARFMLKFQNKIFLKNGEFIKSFNELEHYSYGVAGIVGNLSTKIFMNHDEKNKKAYIRLLEEGYEDYNLAEKTGIFLQYVNIIKDKIKDEHNNQYFWPSNSTEKYESVKLEEMIKQTKPYFEAGKEYVFRLPNNNIGAKMFVSAGILKAFYELNKIIKNDDIEKGKLTKAEKLGTLFKAVNYGLGKNNNLEKLAILT